MTEFTENRLIKLAGLLTEARSLEITGPNRRMPKLVPGLYWYRGVLTNNEWAMVKVDGRVRTVEWIEEGAESDVADLEPGVLVKIYPPHPGDYTYEGDR